MPTHQHQQQQHQHHERHFTGSRIVRDLVIGMSDGLTVPFALAAGLTGATDATRIVLTAGLAEIAAGAIAMGLGGYLAARSDAEHYRAELERERREVQEIPEEEVAEVEQIFATYGVSADAVEPLIAALRKQPARWVDFMMRFELGLEKPEADQARRSAWTIALAYIVGGLVPLAPYAFAATNAAALPESVAITAIALFVFGYVKGLFTSGHPLKSAVQMLAIGSLAAAAAFGLARLLT